MGKVEKRTLKYRQIVRWCTGESLCLSGLSLTVSSSCFSPNPSYCEMSCSAASPAAKCSTFPSSCEAALLANSLSVQAGGHTCTPDLTPAASTVVGTLPCPRRRQSSEKHLGRGLASPAHHGMQETNSFSRQLKVRL